MLNKKKDYITLHKVALDGKEAYKRLIKDTNKVNPIYKNLNYYDQYYTNIAIALWKLEKELKKRNIKSATGFSTIGTNYEVIPVTRNAGSTAPDILADDQFFISEINCLPEEIFYEYIDENGNDAEFDIEYIKAFFALQNKNLVFLMSVFTSTLVELISYIEKNHEMLINDIENGKINSDIKMSNEMREDLEERLSPNPKRAEELRKIFAETSEKFIISKIWNNMTMVITYSFGESSSYKEKLKEYTGDNVIYIHQMYAARKSLVATVVDEAEKSYLLSYNSGFYEFIPVYGENQHALTMNELEVGKLYEVATTDTIKNSMFRTKDVVKVVGFKDQVPLIKFAYRKEQLINICGVKFSIGSISNIVNEFEESNFVDATDYAIYVDSTTPNNRLVLVIETKSDTFEDNNYEKALSALFRRKLSAENEEYNLMYESGKTDKAIVKVIDKEQYNKIKIMGKRKRIPISNRKVIRFLEREALVS